MHWLRTSCSTNIAVHIMVPLFGICMLNYENIYVAWRKALIFIWGVPNITHNRVLLSVYAP